jgi:hypothetical protein
MKRALGAVATSLLLLACGGATNNESPQTAVDVPPAEPPADAAPSTDAAKPDATKPADAEEGAWAGESEAKSEKVPPGAEGKTETRTMDIIAQIVKDNRKPVRDCFDKAKKELPDLKGSMTIHFVIDPEGKVKKAELNQERSEVKAPAVVDCAIKVLQGIKFPASSRGMDTTVNYPYDFK